ncbi:MAG: hypothetical protein DMF65_06895 [Acidobacteria bacterium]|nr:MAG: hypothetical protein DMF65_06895 [Acidobacteriota bacterium]
MAAFESLPETLLASSVVCSSAADCCSVRVVSGAVLGESLLVVSVEVALVEALRDDWLCATRSKTVGSVSTDRNSTTAESLISFIAVSSLNRSGRPQVCVK